MKHQRDKSNDATGVKNKKFKDGKKNGSKEAPVAKKRAAPGKDTELPSKKAKKIKFEKPIDAKKFDKSSKSNFHDKKKNQGTGKPNEKTNGTVLGEKQNWMELRKERKELRTKRRAKKLAEAYEPSVKAKSVWEKLRRADCSKEEKEKLTNKLYELLRGNLDRAIFTHDMARVVQWLVKYCNGTVRDSVMAELKPQFGAMLRSKYAKNCVMKILKHGNAENRRDIINSFYGNIVKYLSNAVAAPIIDYAYANFATETNKLHFRQEFYGDMYRLAKDDNIKSISDVYAAATDMKSATLSAVKINLSRILNKKLIQSPIVQAVLVDYLNVCDNEARGEMIVMLRDSILELSKTENGAKLSMICIWHGTNKDRKSSLKSLKGEIKTLCNSEYGNSVLMAIFDSVDDTVLMKKLVIPEIIADLEEIAGNEHGRRVVLYLVARRDQTYFHPALIKSLEAGDGNATSKKSPEARATELIDAIREPFVSSISENVEFWLGKSSLAVVCLAILKRGQGEKLTSALAAISDFIIDDQRTLKEEDGTERVAIEHSGLHVILKKLIGMEKEFKDKIPATFGQMIADKLDKAIIERWVSFNRACFIIILILENCDDSVVESLKQKLRSAIPAIKKHKSSGATILLKKIQ